MVLHSTLVHSTLVAITMWCSTLYIVNSIKLIRAELKNEELQREINGLKEKNLKDY